MIVVDASALVALLVLRPRPQSLAERLAADEDRHAPHLIDAELVSALRRLVRTEALTVDRASEALDDADLIGVVRYPLVGLRWRMWELRNAVSAYDAAYVALAEALRVPLITTDGRLARSSGHRAAIEAY